MKRLSLPNSAPALVGSALLQPGPALAIAILLVNDHVLKGSLKGAVPGWLTGKLSDFAGLAFFPLLLQTCFQLIAHWRHAPAGRRRDLSERALLPACAITGLVFTLVKTCAPAHDAFCAAWGGVFFMVRALQDGSAAYAPARMLKDSSDLVALPALGLAYLWGRRSSELEAGE